MNRLQHKVAVITGGNSGIGFATAEAFLAEGASRVLITGRDAPAIQAATAHLGERATGLVADVSNLADLKRLAEEVKTAVGTFDVLFVNAGVAAFAPVEAVDEAHFDYQFGINVKGAYFTIQHLLPLMNEGGSIVLNGSINAYIRYAEFERLRGQQSGVAQLCQDAFGGVGRAQNPGERRQPRPGHYAAVR